MTAQNALLLPSGLSFQVLQQVALLAVDVSTIEQDQVTFPEGGGDVPLELAVPYLAGMDEVVVDEARLTLRGADTPLTIDRWHTVAGPGGRGTFVCLDEGPARLVRLVVEEDGTPAQDSFLVLRGATLGAGGAPSAGAPLAASRAFSTGAMLPAPLTNLDVAGSETLTLTFSATSGQAWLVQRATGSSLSELAPAADAPTLTVTAVTVIPAPADVSLVLREGEGAPEQPLWQHPGAVLADAGDQLAVFTPAAGRRLSQALASLNAAGVPAPTLSLPLRFRSARGGTLGMRDRALQVRYLAHPAGRNPVPLALDGGWHELILDAPPRRPSSAVLALTARHLGFVVNGGSGVPPMSAPAGGVRVRAGRSVAGRATWEPAAGGPHPLAQVRLLAVPHRDVEVVCEVRRDAAGRPGELLAPPAVGRVSGSAGPGWVTLALAAPVFLTGTTSLWVTARTNEGELDWFTEPEGPGMAPTGSSGSGAPTPALVSADGGQSWGDVDGGLGAGGRPVTQFLDQVAPATQPSPHVRLRAGETPMGELVLTTGGAAGEFIEPAPPTLPPALLGLLGAPGGETRRRTVISIWSSDLLDVTLTSLTCSYDAFGGA